MRRAIHVAIAGLMVASLLLSTTLVAAAANTKWELDIAPIYFLDATGDSSAPPPPGTFPIYCSGQPGCAGTPHTTDNLRLDYDLVYHFSPRWNFHYAHTNFDFSLGRIVTLAPGTSLLSGSINDREDKLSLNYLAGHGLSLSGWYDSHERTNIEATSLTGGCFFNSVACPGGGSNPSSINSNSWGVGGTYAFGPHQRFQPPMFSAAFNINYFPRTSNPVPCPGQPGNPVGAIPGYQPACGSGGIPGYVGSGVVYGYGLTMFPFADTHIPPGSIPFIGYESLPVWFHAENTPEVYNVMDGGIIQVLPHNLTLSATYFKLQGRYSSDTIPPPDVIRSATFLFKINYALTF
jgi:hypothetical protein